MTGSIDEPTRAALAAHTKEFQALRNSVSNATPAWAEVENAMVVLLTAILNRENMGIPSAMYFALGGIESRLTMVSHAFTELLFEQKKHESAPQLKSLWITQINRLKRLKTTRNAVAHGQIVTVGDAMLPDGTHIGTPRLTSPAYNFSHFRQAHEEGRLPGMSAGGVNGHSRAVHAAAEAIYEIEKCVRFMHEGNTQALREKLVQLGDRHHRQGVPDSQSPTKRASQPPPSQGKHPKMSKRERRDTRIKSAKAARARNKK